MYTIDKEIEESDMYQLWKAHIEVWKRSGIRQSEYCIHQRLNIKVGLWLLEEEAVLSEFRGHHT